MTIWDSHYTALYASPMAVAGTFVTADSSSYSVTVLDKTIGIPVGDGVQVSTITPACDMRASEFFGHGLERNDLKSATITFNGKTWGVEYHEMRPSPEGERSGELRLFLSERND